MIPKPMMLGAVLALTAAPLVWSQTAAVATHAADAVLGIAADGSPGIDSRRWPQTAAPIPRNPSIEASVADLLARMTLAEKVGQIIQADLGSVTPEDVRQYHLGAILNSAETGPDGNIRAEPAAWLALADRFWQASTDTSEGRAGVPLLWGTDAVHGHNNVLGATIFPHNIGLGAAGDPELVARVAHATAREIRVTGLDWTFAPTVAVVRNDRWGRTYEGYAESPALVARYAESFITGLQGRPGQPDFLRGEHVFGTAKHFIGDGGTADGIDQGNNLADETELRDLHGPGYVAAIGAGVQFVMASFSSWHGQRLHGHQALLTDVLRKRMGFDGVVIGDWIGHAHVPGCTPERCAQAINAGLDLFMAAGHWRALHANTMADVSAGRISMARLDEAVARMLRVKLRAGLFEAGLPSQRPVAGEWTMLGGAEHRALAREAVRRSLVLLKNRQALPVAPGARVLVTGPGADNIGMQAGGWSMNWQGTDTSNADFPAGTSIVDGLREAVQASGGTLVHHPTLPAQLPAADVAVVVYGETPYAEFKGDRADVDFKPTEPLATLRRLQAAGIKTVSVFLSGRPLWVEPELAASDAFVAAWLPGTAGRGIADVLVAGADGRPRHDFVGRLSFSWPAAAEQAQVNVGDGDYNPAFAFGFGLSYR